MLLYHTSLPVCSNMLLLHRLSSKVPPSSSELIASRWCHAWHPSRITIQGLTTSKLNSRRRRSINRRLILRLSTIISIMVQIAMLVASIPAVLALNINRISNKTRTGPLPRLNISSKMQRGLAHHIPVEMIPLSSITCRTQAPRLRKL